MSCYTPKQLDQVVTQVYFLNRDIAGFLSIVM